MSLTINSRILADGRIQGVTLRSVLGAYEIVFGLHLTVNGHNGHEEVMHRASIMGARVTVKSSGDRAQSLGFARPESPFEIITYNSSTSMTPALILPLQPGQLAALEEQRGAGDLDFELLVNGIGTDQRSLTQVQDTWRKHIPRSDWIKKLQEAHARNVLLIEVPLPFPVSSEDHSPIARELRRAEEQFRNGDYYGCVGSCRTAIQEFGHRRFEERSWAGPLLTRLASVRDEMTKEEREAALWGALRHYTHQAHHAEGENGVSAYTRSEAQLILTLTASLVARAQAF